MVGPLFAAAPYEVSKGGSPQRKARWQTTGTKPSILLPFGGVLRKSKRLRA